MPAGPNPRRIAILAFPGVQSLDVSGPLEVFAGARALVERSKPGTRSYEVQILSPDGEPLQSSSGMTIVPHASTANARGTIDTLLIAGGAGQRAASTDAELLEWIRSTAAKARRTTSVCTGAFLLAAAGLLDGRRATTHWSAATALARMYPRIEVDAEPIFIRDGPIWTSAGVTAGMDLALALVEEDLDRDAALLLARHLVLFLRRPGNQAQFSATIQAQVPEREPLRESQRAVLERVGDDHSVEAMAARAHMSPRNFARAFRAETGVTPARFVEQVRLEAARRHLEDTAEPVASIAAECGFGSAETMRRTFIRALGVAPAEYRRRFQAHHGRSFATA